MQSNNNIIHTYVKVLSHPGHGIQMQVESKASELIVSLLIKEASSVLIGMKAQEIIPLWSR